MKTTWEDYYCTHEFAMKPVNDSVLLRMAMDLRQEADKEDFLRMETFYLNRGIEKRTWYDWLLRSRPLRAAHDYAIARIGIRREVGASKRIFDSGMIKSTLGYYDEVFKQEQERQAKLKLEAEALDKNKSLTVELNVVEKTPDVKPLEKV